MLDSFEIHLKEHMDFENKNFYEELIHFLKQKGDNSFEVEKVMEDMDNIAKVVMSFLERYVDAESIAKEIDKFARDFGRIFGILMIRIENEETWHYFTECFDK
jgi:regulator of sigma D